MIHYLVYKIKNKVNNRIYIGIHLTSNPNDGYLGSGLVMKRAINKHGPENFEKVILFDYDNKEDMLRMERILVDEYFVNQPDTYNLRRGGTGGQAFGHVVKQETREKIRKGHLGKVVSDETRYKLKISHLGLPGHPLSEEAKERISKANSGRVRTPETIKKLKDSKTDDVKNRLRESANKQWANPEIREKMIEGIHKSSSNPEVRKKISESKIGNQFAKGYIHTQETREKMSKAKRGRPRPKQSEEVKLKHSEASKRIWTNPKHRKIVAEKVKAAWTPERRIRQAEITRNRNILRYKKDNENKN